MLYYRVDTTYSGRCALYFIFTNQPQANPCWESGNPAQPQLPPFKPRWFSNAPRSDGVDDGGDDDDGGGNDDGEVFKCTFSK